MEGGFSRRVTKGFDEDWCLPDADRKNSLEEP